MPQTNEKAFETYVQEILLTRGGWKLGDNVEWDKERALFPAQVFDIGRSIELILAPIVGGIGTIFGPIVGAFILTPLGEGLISLTAKLGVNVPGAKQSFYGLALIAIIVLRPDGVWPWIWRLLRLSERRQ